MAVKVRERPKGSGIWWIFIDHQGKRKAKKIGKNKKFAQDVAEKIGAKLKLGDMDLLDEQKEAKSFKEYADIWLNVTLPATCKVSTQNDYKWILNKHILPVFGKKPVTEISRLMVKKFLMGKIKEGFAQSTVTHIKNAMSGVLNLALDDEVVTINPAHRLGKIFQKKQRDSIDYLTKEELSRLLESCRENFSDHYVMVLTLARTGMRLGEVLALQWGDIDFHNRFIHVRRGFARGKIETPKSGKSRPVDISLQLAATLQELRIRRKKETLRKGWTEVPEWLFVAEKGNPIVPSHWRKKVFKKALEKAGLREIRIHDLRHTYASLLIQAGESLAYVRDQLGHHSIKVTVDVYGHLAPEGNKAAVDRLDDKNFFPQQSATYTQPKKERD